LDLDTANHAIAAKLCLKIKSVSDGNKEDMKEAVDQVEVQGIKALPGPSAIGVAADAVQTAGTLVQGAISFTETWGPILEKLKAFQVIGNYLSEVNALPVFFVLDMC
jgi:hypothetical protein